MTQIDRSIAVFRIAGVIVWLTINSILLTIIYMIHKSNKKLLYMVKIMKVIIMLYGFYYQ